MEENKIVLSSSESLSEVYEDSPLVKAIVQFIPWIGPLINEIVSDKGSKIKELRLQTFLNYLYESLKIIDKQSLKKEWINTEEFYDLLNRAIKSSVNTRCKEKIQINAMIIGNVIHFTDNEQNFRPEEYLAALEDLTYLETKCLLTVYNTDIYNEDNKESPGFTGIEYQNALSEECGLDHSEAIFMLKRLERTGFISQMTGMYFGNTGWMYNSTTALKRLREYLVLNPLSLSTFDERKS